MFEKESQDYAIREVAPRQELYIKGRADIDADYEKVKKIWQDGAEFGYNKANEWHYVKDGEYPIDEKDVEVLYQDCDKTNVYNCIYDIHAKNWLYYNLDNMVLEPFSYDVIAWKEIVLPKESE